MCAGGTRESTETKGLELACTNMGWATGACGGQDECAAEIATSIPSAAPTAAYSNETPTSDARESTAGNRKGLMLETLEQSRGEMVLSIGYLSIFL